MIVMMIFLEWKYGRLPNELEKLSFWWMGVVYQWPLKTICCHFVFNWSTLVFLTSITSETFHHLYWCLVAKIVDFIAGRGNVKKKTKVNLQASIRVNFWLDSIPQQKTRKGNGYWQKLAPRMYVWTMWNVKKNRQRFWRQWSLESSLDGQSGPKDYLHLSISIPSGLHCTAIPVQFYIYCNKNTPLHSCQLIQCRAVHSAAGVGIVQCTMLSFGFALQINAREQSSAM